MLERKTMRRHDKEVTDRAALEEVLVQAEWGTLGLVTPEGRPLMVPLNFVYDEGHLYFHSSPAGEKMATLKAGGEASFLVVDSYALIPSCALDPAQACAASQFYKSVLAYGRVTVVEDLDRKVEVLERLMKRLQPEGGYQPIAAASPMYQAGVKGIAVLAMTVDRLSGKFGLGQNLNPETRAAVVRFLQQRGAPGDARTVVAMAGAATLPGARSH
jgi:nitroimidazol reductase NimA-like FMN-containing flavoprotein (pyridoxamine 5'-phosphate oxidase superfamily)